MYDITNSSPATRLGLALRYGLFLYIWLTDLLCCAAIYSIVSPGLMMCVISGVKIRIDCPTTRSFGLSSPFVSIIMCRLIPNIFAMEYKLSPGLTTYICIKSLHKYIEFVNYMRMDCIKFGLQIYLCDILLSEFTLCNFRPGHLG